MLDAFSDSSKISYILTGQVISLKNMVMLTAKFIISVSWSPIYFPLIHLLALMKLISTSVTIMYKILDNRHHWKTSRARVKMSDRSLFQILGWILVYTSLTI